MNPCSVLKSFLRATQGSLVLKSQTDDETTSSGSSEYFSPSTDLCILAPYNFSFV